MDGNYFHFILLNFLFVYYFLCEKYGISRFLYKTTKLIILLNSYGFYREYEIVIINRSKNYKKQLLMFFKLLAVFIFPFKICILSIFYLAEFKIFIFMNDKSGKICLCIIYILKYFNPIAIMLISNISHMRVCLW